MVVTLCFLLLSTNPHDFVQKLHELPATTFGSCFRLFIDPDPCIDCQACIPECPVQAIYYEDDVPEPWREYIALNREMAPQCPQITEKRSPAGPAAGMAP